MANMYVIAIPICCCIVYGYHMVFVVVQSMVTKLNLLSMVTTRCLLWYNILYIYVYMLCCSLSLQHCNCCGIFYDYHIISVVLQYMVTTLYLLWYSLWLPQVSVMVQSMVTTLYLLWYSLLLPHYFYFGIVYDYHTIFVVVKSMVTTLYLLWYSL